MKKLLITAILGLSLHTVMAQDSTSLHKNRPGRHSNSQKQHGLEQLDLSEAQKIKMRELKLQHRKEMMAVLTPEQREKLKHQRMERKLQREKKSAARMEKMQERLELTPEQKEKLASINKDFQQQVQVTKANETLAAADHRKQLKTLVAEHQDKIQSILTPEQQIRFKELKEQHKNRSAR
jgi:Spy/CpxP family protein refolding chaperone